MLTRCIGRRLRGKVSVFVLSVLGDLRESFILLNVNSVET